MAQLMTEKTKKALIIGTIVGISGLAIYIIWRKIRKEKLLREIGDIAVITDDTKGNVSDSGLGGGGIDIVDNNMDIRPNFNPSGYAQDLLNAVQGGGTDECGFMQTLTSLSCGERELVEDYFNQFTSPDYSLADWISWDFTDDEEHFINRLMACEDIDPANIPSLIYAQQEADMEMCGNLG
jgi:hypothetical protein